MTKKPFKWLDTTTSDVCFQARGENLSELFKNAGLALEETIVDTKQIKQKISKKIKVKGIDLKQLMFLWLGELIYYQDAENLAFSGFDVEVNQEELILSADVHGEELDQDRHKTKTHVKACTYHKMKIEKNKEWTARVILDI